MKDNSRNRIGERPMDRSLNDKAYDLFGELLLEQETNKLLEEIEDEKARGDTAEMDAFLPRTIRKTCNESTRTFIGGVLRSC